MSDSHGEHHRVKVPVADVLIHCGDCTDDIGRQSLRFFLEWLESQPHKHKLFIAGNHDGAFEKWPDLAKAMVKDIAPSCTYLENSGVEIDGVKFWGSPYTPTFMDWHFNCDRGEPIRAHWDLIPADTNVLITHGPPMGYNDWSVYDKIHVGCEELLKVIERIQPKIHCFGHIHASYGTQGILHEDSQKTTSIVNASVVNEKYRVVNAPWVVDI